MWSSSSLRRGVMALALLAPFALAGCSSLRPVYGDAAAVRSEMQFAYGKPASRLDQIIIQDLALRLGNSRDPDAPRITISASSASRALTRTNVVKPVTQYEVAVTATYTVTADGKVVAKGSRRASASYTTSGQVLADEAALKDATERAGHEVAESIRLAILGQLSTPVQ